MILRIIVCIITTHTALSMSDQLTFSTDDPLKGHGKNLPIPVQKQVLQEFYRISQAAIDARAKQKENGTKQLKKKPAQKDNAPTGLEKELAKMIDEKLHKLTSGESVSTKRDRESLDPERTRLYYALIKRLTRPIKQEPVEANNMYRIKITNDPQQSLIFIVVDLAKKITNLSKRLANKNSKKSVAELTRLVLPYMDYFFTISEGRFYITKNITQLLLSDNGGKSAYPVTELLLFRNEPSS